MIIETVMALAVLIGLPILCWIDPAGHRDAEIERRNSEKGSTHVNP